MPPVSPLRRYNPLSVLRNINLADTDEINKTMHYLARCEFGKFPPSQCSPFVQGYQISVQLWNWTVRIPLCETELTFTHSGLDKSGNIAGSKRIAEQALATIDKGPIQRIVKAIERNTDYPLLKMAVERLLEARDHSRLEILGAVSEIEHLAEEKVLLNPTVWINEYVEALDRFLELPPLEFVEVSLLPEIMWRKTSDFFFR